MQEKYDVVIILPAHNEATTIAEMIFQIDRLVSGFAVVVVDNASTDTTRSVAESALSSLMNNHGVLLIENSKGKSLAVGKAFRTINATTYILCDADQTYDLADIGKLVEAVTVEGFDMAVADRHTLGDYSSENRRRFHNLGNKLIPLFINLVYKSRLKDVLSGYRAFSESFVRTYVNTVRGFELEVDLTLHALDKNFSIKEIPSGYKNRPEGSESKLRTYSDGLRIIRVILRLFRYYKPLGFFSTLSIVALLAACYAGSLPIADYLNYQYVYHIPRAILASGLALVSLILFFMGIILDSIKDMNFRVQAFNRK